MTPTPTDVTKAALVLTSRLADVDARRFPPTEWSDLVSRFADAQLSPAAAFELDFDPERVLRVDAATADRMRALLAARSSIGFELDRLAQLGIWVMSTEDAAYPARLKGALGPLAPPVLFGSGDADLLGTPAVGVVGSRNVSPEGAEFASLVAEAAVQHGRALVSGAARGVDRVAMNAAYAVGGAVIGVLADALEKRIRSRDIRQALLGGRTCLITPLHPNAGFSVGAAMGRNKIVYGLADVVVVVASALESGGTWAGAVEALDKGITSVAVWRGPGEGEGNAALEDRGAVAVKSIDDVVAFLGGDAVPSNPAAQQLGIFDDEPAG